MVILVIKWSEREWVNVSLLDKLLSMTVHKKQWVRVTWVRNDTQYEDRWMSDGTDASPRERKWEVECVEVSEMFWVHYNDVIMSSMASQITSCTINYATNYSATDQRKHQSSASLAFVRGIHRVLVNSPQKRPVTRKMCPFDDVIMERVNNRKTNAHIVTNSVTLATRWPVVFPSPATANQPLIPWLIFRM